MSPYQIVKFMSSNSSVGRVCDTCIIFYNTFDIYFRHTATFYTQLVKPYVFSYV